ncbi:cytochrome b [Wenxinia saemankumensis]|uniref:Cytochrome b561 n=1 Tax=Wenxinia saemankumensis TaxID=1447782 RepID=A0A1M6C2G1_9RHOB|nr:cytochrome b/b6 domain-containing protein [Wenxinia saemankumensis]SHI55143.1 cytochrome b561 [Wenxinia saemankumensis]
MADRRSYSALQIALHWIVALLVLATWWLGEGMGRALHARIESGGSGSWPVHVWLGLAVLVLVGVRLIVRLASGAPDPVESAGGAVALAAKASHWLLYALLLLVPLGGALAWFAGIEGLAEVHPAAANALMLLALLHAAAALWHHYVRGDGTLRRMMRPGHHA